MHPGPQDVVCSRGRGIPRIPGAPPILRASLSNPPSAVPFSPPPHSCRSSALRHMCPLVLFLAAGSCGSLQSRARPFVADVDPCAAQCHVCGIWSCRPSLRKGGRSGGLGCCQECPGPLYRPSQVHCKGGHQVGEKVNGIPRFVRGLVGQVSPFLQWSPVPLSGLGLESSAASVPPPPLGVPGVLAQWYTVLGAVQPPSQDSKEDPMCCGAGQTRCGLGLCAAQACA